MHWRAVVAVGLFIGVGQFGVLFVAMNIGLRAGLASVIAPLQPVFTIPLAVIALGERPSLREVIGVGLAVAGLGAILPVAPMASLFRQSRSVSRPRHRAGEHPTWGELLGSLVGLVGLGLALGVVDALAVPLRTAARMPAPIPTPRQ